MAWFNTDWEFRKKITIPKEVVDGDLVDWPFTFYLDADSDLAADAQDNGDDILFTKSDGETQLSHEIESYNSSTGTLWAHVKLPSVSALSDTSIYVYYGNGSASNQENVADVWSNGYVGVWHLGEEASGTGSADLYKDSTANDYHGTDEVSATGQDGQIEEGQQFNADNKDRIVIPHDLNSHFNGNATLNKWLRRETDNTPSDDTKTGFSRFEKTGSSDERTHYPWTAGGLYIATFNDSRLVNGVDDTGFDKTQWHRVTVTNDPNSDWLFYRNGSVDFQRGGLGSISLPPDEIYIGDSDDTDTYYFNGRADEVRLANVTRSNAWISTEYANQNDPIAFYSVGSEETDTEDTTTAGTYDTAAPLAGPVSKLPDPNGAFFNGKPSYRYVYFAYDGTVYKIETGDSSWTQIA